MKRVGTLVLVLAPVLLFGLGGWLVSATVNARFEHRYGPDPEPGDKFVIARSCARIGPITSDGWGYHWECRADGPRGETSVRFLAPDDIGRKVAVKDQKKRRGSQLVRASQLSSGLATGMALLAWAVWAGLCALTTWLVIRVHERRNPAAGIGRGRRVRTGTPPFLDWRHPVRISPEGIGWHGHQMPWREVREARLAGDTMYIKPLIGETVAIGPFTGPRLLVVHQALELFIRNRYRDERVSSAR